MKLKLVTAAVLLAVSSAGFAQTSATLALQDRKLDSNGQSVSVTQLNIRTKLFSEKLANTHFWIATLAILIYAIPLYWAAVTQWLMWREYTPEGFLAYPNFLETLTQILPMYHMRILGGLLFLTGFLIMVYNLYYHY